MMNERIKELEKQSVYYNEDEDVWEFNRQKFAELIVGECADLCSDLDGGENMFSRGIRKHFGVE